MTSKRDLLTSSTSLQQIARRGAETLDSAKRSVLAAVEEAGSAGHVVGEDLSVTPPRGGMAAQAQAQPTPLRSNNAPHSWSPRTTAIAAKITTASAPLHERQLPPNLQGPPAARALGAGFKLDHQW